MEYDFIIFILFILLVLIVSYILVNLSATNIIIGGSIVKKLLIGDNAKIVIDGNNLIHQLSENYKLSDNEFNTNLKIISSILTINMPKKDIHIVIKNNPKITFEETFTIIKEISDTFPKITYHVAYGSESYDKSQHHLKARDDLLALYLSIDGYIVSKDRYNDFRKFSNIKPFYHFECKKGIEIIREKINPKDIFHKISTPNLGNHLNFKILNQLDAKKSKLKSGEIYIDKEGTSSYLVLIIN